MTLQEKATTDQYPISTKMQKNNKNIIRLKPITTTHIHTYIIIHHNLVGFMPD
jgi:hypothetical protein